MGCDVDKWRKRRQWEPKVTDDRQDAWSVGFANLGQVASHWWLKSDTTQSNAWWTWLDSGILLSPSNPLVAREQDVFYKYQSGLVTCWVTVDFTGFNSVQPDLGTGHTVLLVLTFNIYEPLTQTDVYWSVEARFLIPTTNRAFSFDEIYGGFIPIPPTYPPIGAWELTPLDRCHDCTT